jgi:hypothetical protein
MSSKEVALQTETKDIVLPTRAYNTEIEKVNAETHYRTPFQPEWFKEVRSTMPESVGFGIATGMLSTVLAGATMMVLIPDLSFLLFTGASFIGIVPGAFLGRMRGNKQKLQFRKAKNTTKEHLSQWLNNRYSIEVENLEIEKIVEYMTRYPYNKEDFHFVSNIGDPYVLKSSDNNVWYVIPYAPTVELVKEERLAYTPQINTAIEVRPSKAFTDDQQELFNKITTKAVKLKSLKLDTEKSFIAERISNDLKEVLKLNSYGVLIDSERYDSSKITVILTLLDKEIDSIFGKELEDIGHKLDAKVEALSIRLASNH